MRLARYIVRLCSIPCAALTVTASIVDAQYAIEPVFGWTWEGRYYDWDRSSTTGYSRVAVEISPALMFGARARIPLRGASTHMALGYSQTRPELDVAYDLFTSGGGASSSSFGRLATDATIHRFELGLTQALPRLPMATEIGGSMFFRRLSADTDRTPGTTDRRNYDNVGVSLRTSAGGATGRWGDPRIGLEVGAVRTSGQVWIDYLALFTTADPEPQWSPFVTISAGWRISP